MTRRPLDIRHANRDRPWREEILAWFEAALLHVDPAAIFQRALTHVDDTLLVGDHAIELPTEGDVYVVGAGKAAEGMASGLESVLGGRIAKGMVATERDDGTLDRIDVVEASHPQPDARSRAAGRRALEVAERAGTDDLVVALVSGGGSALMEMPDGWLDLDDLRRTTELLLESGEPIERINAVRKHLSALKGGRLARAIAPARTITCLVSDVVGDRLDTIASGPTAPDATTFDDALEVLEEAESIERVPDVVVEHLGAGANGALQETPKPGEKLFDEAIFEIVASRHDALEAVEEAADESGFATEVLTTEMTGEAKELARECVERAASVCRNDDREGPVCLVACGESTVSVTGSGTGGRNQEMALAAALEMDSRGWDDTSCAFAALATDGIDGPTDAAGAIVDPSTVRRGREQYLEASDFLDDNDSHPYLAAVGDLVETGPTGTNVNDLVVAVVSTDW
jgi:hydroxypyruvate reductase